MTPRALLSVLALTALLGGCVKQSGTVEIYQACSPPTPSAGGGCLYPSGSCTSSPLDPFFIDVDVASQLFVGIEVHNQLSDNSNADTGGLNTHNAFVDHYTVSYSEAFPGVSNDMAVVVPTSGSSVIGVRFVDENAWAALYTQLHGTTTLLRVRADLKLFGKFGDQSSFETAPRSFPIEICAGCFVPLACDAGKQPLYCPGVGVGPAAATCGGTGFNIGGTVSGLTTDGLVLQCSGLPVLSVPANATTFTFSDALFDGTSFTCTILQQPTGHTCDYNGSPTYTNTVSGANITDIPVTCT